MLKFISLISGSSGNSTLVSDEHTTLLIDCGMSGKRLIESLGNVGISPCDIDGVLVTHEHSDHVLGIGVIARKFGFKIYGSAGTLSGMNTGKINDEQLITIDRDNDFEIGSIGVKPFLIPHDAKEPFGYSFFADNKKVSLATDIGCMNDYILKNLKGSESVILESNHDIEMLRYGSYPYELKRRILGNTGHLSNESAAEAAVNLVNSGTEHIMLGHLSNENNLPDIAYMTTANSFSENNIIIEKDVTLKVADRYSPTSII